MPESATEYYKKVASHLFSSLGWPCGYRIVFLGSFFGVFFLGGGGFLGNFGQFWAIWGVFLGGALFRYRSIRALAPAMCSFHCAHTPPQVGYVLVSLRAYASAGRLCARFTARIRRPSLARRCIAVRRSKLPTDFVWREIIRSSFCKTMT